MPGRRDRAFLFLTDNKADEHKYLNNIVPINYLGNHGMSAHRSKCKSSAELASIDPFLALKRGNLALMQNLVESGNVHLHNVRWSGFTLLHKSAEIGFTELCEYLIDRGLDPNVRSTRGWYTALHIALGHGYLDTGLSLIKLGSNPWLKNKYNQDAFEYGGTRGYKKICDEFRLTVMKMDMQASLSRNLLVSAAPSNNSDSNSNEIQPS